MNHMQCKRSTKGTGLSHWSHTSSNLQPLISYKIIIDDLIWDQRLQPLISYELPYFNQQSYPKPTCDCYAKIDKDWITQNNELQVRNLSISTKNLRSKLVLQKTENWPCWAGFLSHLTISNKPCVVIFILKMT